MFRHKRHTIYSSIFRLLHNAWYFSLIFLFQNILCSIFSFCNQLTSIQYHTFRCTNEKNKTLSRVWSWLSQIAGLRYILCCDKYYKFWRKMYLGTNWKHSFRIRNCIFFVFMSFDEISSESYLAISIITHWNIIFPFKFTCC